MTMDLPTTDDRPVWDLWLSMYHLPAVTAAIELDVFEALATSPATHDELARRLNLSERATEIVLPLFASLGLLSRYDGRYQLDDVARLYLLRGSPYDWGALLNRMGPSSPHHAAIRQALKGERASTTPEQLNVGSSGAPGPSQVLERRVHAGVSIFRHRNARASAYGFPKPAASSRTPRVA